MFVDSIWLQKQFDEVNRNISIAISRINDTDQNLLRIETEMNSRFDALNTQFQTLNDKLDEILKHYRAVGFKTTFDSPVEK